MCGMASASQTRPIAPSRTRLRVKSGIIKKAKFSWRLANSQPDRNCGKGRRTNRICFAPAEVAGQFWVGHVRRGEIALKAEIRVIAFHPHTVLVEQVGVLLEVRRFHHRMVQIGCRGHQAADRFQGGSREDFVQWFTVSHCAGQSTEPAPEPRPATTKPRLQKYGRSPHPKSFRYLWRRVSWCFWSPSRR